MHTYWQCTVLGNRPWASWVQCSPLTCKYHLEGYFLHIANFRHQRLQLLRVPFGLLNLVHVLAHMHVGANVLRSGYTVHVLPCPPEHHRMWPHTARLHIYTQVHAYNTEYTYTHVRLLRILIIADSTCMNDSNRLLYFVDASETVGEQKSGWLASSQPSNQRDGEKRRQENAEAPKATGRVGVGPEQRETAQWATLALQDRLGRAWTSAHRREWQQLRENIFRRWYCVKGSYFPPPKQNPAEINPAHVLCNRCCQFRPTPSPELIANWNRLDEGTCIHVHM